MRRKSKGSENVFTQKGKAHDRIIGQFENVNTPIVKINEESLTAHLDEKIRHAVQETINAMLQAEERCNAARTTQTLNSTLKRRRFPIQYARERVVF